MRKKLSSEQIEVMRADYLAWRANPAADGRNAEEVAAGHGVSKQTMYTHLREPAPRPRRAPAAGCSQAEVDGLRAKLAEAHEAIVFLTRELAVARVSPKVRRSRKQPAGK